MSSKINGVENRSATVDAGYGVQRSREAPAGNAQTPNRGADRVHITSRASQLAALEQALRELPAVDEARVAQIRSAIESGRYVISPEHIASQLVQLEQALGKLPNGGK